MKTLKDLFELVLSITVANDGKAVQYFVSIDLQYNWVSLACKNNGAVVLEKYNFVNMPIDSPEELQEVYWKLFNSTRHPLTAK